MNASPYKGRLRLSERRKGKPGTLLELQRLLWEALQAADAVLHATAQDNPDLTLKACHCVSQCAGQYAKLLEVGELEARLQALEAQARGGREQLDRTYKLAFGAVAGETAGGAA